MLLPDFLIVPRFLRRKQSSDNSTLLLLQCTNLLKSSRDSALSAPRLPQPRGPEAGLPTQQRPDVKRNAQLLMQQAHRSSMGKHLLQLLACNLLNTLAGQCGLGMGKDTTPRLLQETHQNFNILRQTRKPSQESGSGIQQKDSQHFPHRKATE